MPNTVFATAPTVHLRIRTAAITHIVVILGAIVNTIVAEKTLVAMVNTVRCVDYVAYPDKVSYVAYDAM